MSIKSMWKAAISDFANNDRLGKFDAGVQTVLSTCGAGLGVEYTVLGEYKLAAGAAVFAVGNIILARFDLRRRRAKQNMIWNA